MVSVVWYRNDLRVTDHAPMNAACALENQPIIPLYIHDHTSSARQRGGASCWWLHHSLKCLEESLQQRGASLILRKGSAEKILDLLVQKHGVTHVFWQRRYDAASVAQDTIIKENLRKKGVTVQSFPGLTLFEPHKIFNKQQKPFQVFTFFWKHCISQSFSSSLLSAPDKIRGYKTCDSETLDDLNLLPKGPINWAQNFSDSAEPGENGAYKALDRFLVSLNGYKKNRDFPAQMKTSRLSPHLAFGELSPRVLWHEIHQHIALYPEATADADCFLSELGWRDFAHYLLYHFPQLPHTPLRKAFLNFPWQPDSMLLKKWQCGQTGYPLVDAGMRELWATGNMHNRVRMLVGSFLIKHLLQPWQHGESWFWDTLLDADMASNAMNWQWVAGCGVDASPFFRIFNPITQSEKFDPKGTYIKKWVPELSALPVPHLYAPWMAPPSTLRHYHITLGKTYPFPIVDHQQARAKALQIFATLK